MQRRRRLLLAVPMLLLPATPLAAQAPAPPDSALMAGLVWRSIGPANMSGRITDVEGLASPSKTFYVAAAAGGIWKTTNGGTTFRPIFDDQRVVSMGDLAIAPSDTLQVWAGTGEEDSRNSISPGGGIYKSTDGGKSWTLMGLEATQAIGRIVVHPTNPDIVYVAALGHPWGANEERGLYKTTDGGRSWKRIEFISDRAGFVDLAMDPRDPDVLFASSWERIRGPYSLQSGGPGSALWKTTDGGATWTEVTGGGFPETTKGRIGIAIARSNPDVVYALVEADSLDGKRLSGLYRSADGGRTWTQQNDNNVRPFYYSQVRVSPTDPDHVFWSSTPVNFSRDGGKTVGQATRGIHVDHHAMWWDPKDPERFVVGNDGGIGITLDAGGSYDFVNTFALGQFYAVSYDMAIPYTVCGGLQDNGTWCGPSRRASGGITSHMWYSINGGDGFVTAQDPRDASIVYAESQGGNMARVNLRTGERVRLAKPDWREKAKALRDTVAVLEMDSARAARPEAQARIAELKSRIAADSAALDLRWNWNTPFLLSPHDPDVFYAGANRVLKSTRRGADLEPISPDLSYADTMKIRVSTKATGGVTWDVTGAETYATIVSLAESPLAKGTLFAGTDDGRVWVTRDDGASWEELTARLKGVPKGTYVSRIEPSWHDADVFYVAFDGHRNDDYTPYVYATADGGRSFRSIARGLPTGGPDFVHVVREDPTNPDLLFVGTDLGVYVSTDRGASWRRFMNGLPTVPVHDLRIHPRERELIAGTHGRSIWIVDIAPLQQTAGRKLAEGPVLFEPKQGLQYGDTFVGGESTGHKHFEGESVQFGAEIAYLVPAAAAPVVARRDARPDSARGARGQGGGRAAFGFGGGRGGPQAEIVVLDARGDTVQTLNGPMRPGLQRVYWNLRKRPERQDLSPSERRDSLEAAQRLRAAADSMIAGGKDEQAVERALEVLQSGDRSAMTRMFRRGGGSTERGFVERPGESYPRAEAGAGQRPGREGAGEGGAEADDPADVMRDLARASGMGFGGRRGPGAPLVEPGEYTVVVKIGEQTLTQKLRVERAAGFELSADEDTQLLELLGVEGEEHER